MPANIRRRYAIASAVLAIVVFTAERARATPITWAEIGDAGPAASPQLLAGGPYDQIEGDIGAVDNNGVVTDDSDAFAFRWNTAGRFEAQYVPGDVPRPDRDLLLYLFHYGETSFGSEVGGGFGTPGFSVADLAAGDYVLLVAWVPDPGVDDPHYVVDVTGPTPGALAALDATSAVPEPSTLMLMSGGVALLMRRRRAR